MWALNLIFNRLLADDQVAQSAELLSPLAVEAGFESLLRSPFAPAGCSDDSGGGRPPPDDGS